MLFPRSVLFREICKACYDTFYEEDAIWATNRMMPPGNLGSHRQSRILQRKQNRQRSRRRVRCSKPLTKIDAEDFGITKESMQDAAQKLKASANRIGESLNDAKTELDRRVLRPVFKEDLY